MLRIEFLSKMIHLPISPLHYTKYSFITLNIHSFIHLSNYATFAYEMPLNELIYNFSVERGRGGWIGGQLEARTAISAAHTLDRRLVP